LLKVAQAMRLGASDELIHNACRIDPWFLAEIRGLIEAEAEIAQKGLPVTGGAVPPPEGDGLFRQAPGQADRQR